MMQLIKYPPMKDWASLLQRPYVDDRKIRERVSNILASVKANGDQALREYAQLYDSFNADTFRLPDEQWAKADSIDDALKQAINTAISNITRFHEGQKEDPVVIETMPGIRCWRKSVPIERVGFYIPGGSAPLFSTLLMLAIPAIIAGCTDITLCTPPGTDGYIHPAILYAARQTGIRNIYRLGGAQAIAAMAYGTESIQRVAKIFGPGNQYVTCAKTLVQQEGIAIDIPAGPSEVAVLADSSCSTAFVAADLLSQAEHGPDSQVLLVSDREGIIEEVQSAIKAQLERLPRKDIAIRALGNSKAILVSTIAEGLQLINEYAPEHLIIACRNSMELAEQVINAGSVFLGNYTPESAGDYASGTNHTLPTNGGAKAYSGVSADSFVRKITFQEITRTGLENISGTIISMAEAEGLRAHANAVTVRLSI